MLESVRSGKIDMSSVLLSLDELVALKLNMYSLKPALHRVEKTVSRNVADDQDDVDMGQDYAVGKMKMRIM
ncbi:uncharacterized protein JN550_006618 [Neoarthrinium moseri]|uniref:uncharacterized protein n=1 Tax=Neoarthrinium moseri TaxID=1658444 RepID=UPI001FDB1E46|nr:uncharacterized protein JN550_006618 [Neoarthrinium moseri]KAI1868130.1 hypothetical protein JN550_006618 [Neoarthrinium moseri]